MSLAHPASCFFFFVLFSLIFFVFVFYVFVVVLQDAEVAPVKKQKRGGRRKKKSNPGQQPKGRPKDRPAGSKQEKKKKKQRQIRRSRKTGRAKLAANKKSQTPKARKKWPFFFVSRLFGTQSALSLGGQNPFCFGMSLNNQKKANPKNNKSK